MGGDVKVLVVDDEEIVCVSIKKILKREGYEVDIVMKASDALKQAEAGSYDLIITDLMMPEMNGIELMHALRKYGEDTPFLMVTGYPTIRTAMQALRLGAVDYIPKPFTRVELISPVNRALRKKDPAGSDLSDLREKEKIIHPGDRFILPEHSWAIYDQDGTVAVGIEESFLSTAGTIHKIDVPANNEMVEQGFPTIKLYAENENEHSVFSPFSGRVVSINDEVVTNLSRLSSSECLFRIIPSDLHAETKMLVKD
jgi:DNA-binding response OmpR family regulator